MRAWYSAVMGRSQTIPRFLLLFSFGILLCGAGRDPDFSGRWILDRSASNLAGAGNAEAELTISHTDTRINCAAGEKLWAYPMDGKEIRRRVGTETHDFSTKWEGVALLVNTVVSGPQNYSIAERWRLSRDRNILTINRQTIRLSGESEGALVYRREGTAAPASPPPPPPPQTALTRRAEPAPAPPAAAAPVAKAPPTLTVPLGTRVLLTLINEVNTKHSRDGDHVYLRTDSPVAIDGRLVIPRGSDVGGSITHAKPAGKVKGKGELYIRFDTLVLPNGVARDFQARPPKDEGKVESEGKPADAATVMTGAGMGATIGGVSRGLAGAGVGGAVGALTGVLLSRNQNVILKPGTPIEMVLDRDLVFRLDELDRVR
jgi:hypothetical protein